MRMLQREVATEKVTEEEDNNMVDSFFPLPLSAALLVPIAPVPVRWLD